MRDWLRKPEFSGYFIPILFFTLAELLNDFVLHQAMRIPYDYMQLMDKSLLQQHLMASLILLHAQPPMLNLVLGILLKTAAALHVRPEVLAGVAFGCCGLTTGLLLFRLTAQWTRSPFLAGFAVLLFYANPSYFGGSNAGIGRNTFFYEFALQPTLLLVFVSAFRWLRDFNKVAGALFILSVGTVVNTRSLFSPVVWGAVLVGFVLWGSSRKFSRYALLLSACALVLLFIWPLKNYILFGQFVSSSVDAYNLARAYSPLPRPLDDLFTRGESPPAPDLLKFYPKLTSFKSAELAAVTAPRKLNGVPNANNLIILITRPETLARAIRAREDLYLTFQRISLMYLFSTRPMYQQPYTLSIFEGYPEAFREYASFDQLLFFSPVGRKIAPNRFFNVFNVFLLPGLTIAALLALLVHDKSRVLLGLLIFTTMLPIICSSLSDGFEGNRMRHSTYPLMILLTMIVSSTLGRFAKLHAKLGITRYAMLASRHSQILKKYFSRPFSPKASSRPVSFHGNRARLATVFHLHTSRTIRRHRGQPSRRCACRISLLHPIQ